MKYFNYLCSLAPAHAIIDDLCTRKDQLWCTDTKVINLLPACGEPGYEASFSAPGPWTIVDVYMIMY